MRISLLAGLLALVAAAPAAAAVDRSASVGLGKAAFDWSGGDGTVSFANQFPIGFYDSADPDGSCNSSGLPIPVLDFCDITAIEVTDPGVVSFTLPSAGDGLVDDWDMYVYAAEADGTAGELLHAGEEIGGPESFSVETEPGRYVVVAVPYQAVTTGFTGSVSWALPEAE